MGLAVLIGFPSSAKREECLEGKIKKKVEIQKIDTKKTQHYLVFHVIIFFGVGLGLSMSEPKTTQNIMFSGNNSKEVFSNKRNYRYVTKGIVLYIYVKKVILHVSSSCSMF